jgi:pimeloyl-ACP methyl ester carboxylesterase
MPHASANGIEICYEVHGEGPRLLFVNGSGATLATTGMMLQPYAQRFEVLAFDQRGLGRTTIPPGPYEMADYAADAAALLAAVGWDTCAVTGTSFGGMVAQEFAVTFPERVERLALVCTSPGGDFASYPLHRLAELPAAEAAALAPQLLDTRFTPEWLATHDDDRAVAEMVGAMRDQTKPDDVRRGELAQLDARSRLDVLDRLHRISCPTLVASGRYDGIAPPRNGEEIEARVPRAQLRLYEGGHLFMMQDARAMPDILDFLAGDEGSLRGDTA